MGVQTSLAVCEPCAAFAEDACGDDVPDVFGVASAHNRSEYCLIVTLIEQVRMGRRLVSEETGFLAADEACHHTPYDVGTGRGVSVPCNMDRGTS